MEGEEGGRSIVKAFEYVAPTTVGEAVERLAEKGSRARPLAGGTDLIVQMRRGVLDVDRVVDVKKIPELNAITYHSGEGLTVGAAVSCYRIIENADIIERYPGLVDAVSCIGGTAVKGRATMGGNLCNAAPSADSIPAMMILEAVCTIAGPAGTRTMPVERFCTGPGKTVLRHDELLVSVHFPPPGAHSGTSYLRFIPRREMDIAVVGVGAKVDLTDDFQKILSARIALGAVAPAPLLVREVSDLLAGKSLSETAFEEASVFARAAARPITDMRGSLAYRQHLVGILAQRALRSAVDRARKQ
jgi:CO/xanthine dehydrogenase FAD-binding subunit